MQPKPPPRSSRKAGPLQLWLHPKNTDAYARLVEEIYRAAREVHPAGRRPLTILQLTHSGRYSRPVKQPQPIIAHHSPVLDPRHQLPPDYPLISDSELERLEDLYVEAARRAAKAGFDGVDIKACHRYLISELLASFTRENSRYGGSFENRIRFFCNIVQKVRQEVPDLLVTARLKQYYDAMAYPYGFGVNRDDPGQPDLSEPIQVANFLQNSGAPLMNLTVGTLDFNPSCQPPL